MYGTHTLAPAGYWHARDFCNFVRMKIISLIFIRFSYYISLIRNTGPKHKFMCMRYRFLAVDQCCIFYFLFVCEQALFFTDTWIIQ